MLHILLLVVLTSGCQDDNYTTSTGSLPIPDDPRPIGLSAPTLHLGVGIETGDFSFSWTASPGATYYSLQTDMVPWFSIPKVVYTGPNRIYYLGYKSNYSFSSYYRVRAENQSSRSNWSDTLKFPE